MLKIIARELNNETTIWANKHGLKSQTRDITKRPLTKDELMHLCRLTENGIFDLMKVCCDSYDKIEREYNISELELDDVFNLMIAYPDILETPIAYDQRELVVGGDDRKLRKFLNHKAYRKDVINSLFKEATDRKLTLV